jgi:hypothetical protein
LDERKRGDEIGKAPTRISLVFPDNSSSVSDPNVSRIMEVAYSSIQFEIIRITRTLDNKGVFDLVA